MADELHDALTALGEPAHVAGPAAAKLTARNIPLANVRHLAPHEVDSVSDVIAERIAVRRLCEHMHATHAPATGAPTVLAAAGSVVPSWDALWA